MIANRERIHPPLPDIKTLTGESALLMEIYLKN
jgi:hypothetical protein